MGTVMDGMELRGCGKGQGASNEVLKRWPEKMFSRDKKKKHIVELIKISLSSAHTHAHSLYLG